MIPNDAHWIRRKELAWLAGVSYNTIRRNEIRLGLAVLMVRVGPRIVRFPRSKAIEKLKGANWL